MSNVRLIEVQSEQLALAIGIGTDILFRATRQWTHKPGLTKHLHFGFRGTNTRTRWLHHYCTVVQCGRLIDEILG